jgi:hypothetical protein
LLACVPILLRQRSELTVTTWIPAPTPRLILRFLGDLVPMLVVLAVLVVWAAHMLLPRQRQAPSMPTEQARGSRDLAGLLGLSLLPLVIVVLSYLVQPSIQPKYALPTVAVFGPLIAWLFNRASRRAALGLCLLLLVVSAAELWRLAEVRRQFNGQIDQLITILSTHGDDAPLIIEDRGILYATSNYAPELAPRCHGFYFDDERPGGLNPSLVHERELGLSFERFYGQPRFLRLSELRGETRFYVVPIGTNAAQIGEWLVSDYPGFQATLVTDGLYEMKPSENSTSGPASGSSR